MAMLTEGRGRMYAKMAKDVALHYGNGDGFQSHLFLSGKLGISIRCFEDDSLEQETYIVEVLSNERTKNYELVLSCDTSWPNSSIGVFHSGNWMEALEDLYSRIEQ